MAICHFALANTRWATYRAWLIAGCFLNTGCQKHPPKTLERLDEVPGLVRGVS